MGNSLLGAVKAKFSRLDLASTHNAISRALGTRSARAAIGTNRTAAAAIVGVWIHDQVFGWDGVKAILPAAARALPTRSRVWLAAGIAPVRLTTWASTAGLDVMACMPVIVRGGL